MTMVWSNPDDGDDKLVELHREVRGVSSDISMEDLLRETWYVMNPAYGWRIIHAEPYFFIWRRDGTSQSWSIRVI